MPTDTDKPIFHGLANKLKTTNRTKLYRLFLPNKPNRASVRITAIDFKRILANLDMFGTIEVCELSALWSHFVSGVMAPVNVRRNGATLFPA